MEVGLKEIDSLTPGDLFKKKPGAKRVFEYRGYCRTNKRYQGDDLEDISESIYLKKGSLIYEY